MSRESKVIEIPLPVISKNAERMEWRKEILALAQQPPRADGAPFFGRQKVEIIVTFFLDKPESEPL